MSVNLRALKSGAELVMRCVLCRERRGAVGASHVLWRNGMLRRFLPGHATWSSVNYGWCLGWVPVLKTNRACDWMNGGEKGLAGLVGECSSFQEIR